MFESDEEETIKSNDPETIINFCRENKLDLIIPNHHTLVIDIDSEKDYKRFQKNLKVLRQEMYFSVEKETTSRSKSEGRHIYIHTSENLDAPKRVMFQALLGSDSTRECHSYILHLRGEQACSFVFEKREEIECSSDQKAPSTPES